jgi:hypothetical protein
LFQPANASTLIMDYFISMGFEESAVRIALDNSGGNTDIAMEILLGEHTVNTSNLVRSSLVIQIDGCL